MNAAFEAIYEEPTRTRRATAPARDYAPADPETPQAESEPLVTSFLIPVDPAPLSTRTRQAVAKSPEIVELQKIATEDSKARELQSQFTREAARAAFKASMSAAIEIGDGDKIRNIPSEAEQIASYEAAHKQLDEKLRRIGKTALPHIEALTAKAIKLILRDRAEAEVEFAEVFTKRGLPAPATSGIADAFTRTAQNLQRDLEFRRAGIVCNPISQFLAGIGVA